VALEVQLVGALVVVAGPGRAAGARRIGEGEHVVGQRAGEVGRGVVRAQADRLVEVGDRAAHEGARAGVALLAATDLREGRPPQLLAAQEGLDRLWRSFQR